MIGRTPGAPGSRKAAFSADPERTEPQRTALAIALCGLLFLSGAAGLLYETAWTRLYRDLFGNTIQTVAAVVAAYMAGLALGGWAAGRFGDRVRHPLRLYGLLECCIGLWILLSAPFTSLIDRWLPGLLGAWWSSPGPGDGIRWGLAFLLLILPTSAMGATLPVVARAAVAGSRSGRAGSRAAAAVDRPIARIAGILYGANTFGATAGALLAGYVLIGAWGVRATLWLGSAIGLIVGAAAVALSTRESFAREGRFLPSEQNRHTTDRQVGSGSIHPESRLRADEANGGSAAPPSEPRLGAGDRRSHGDSLLPEKHLRTDDWRSRGVLLLAGLAGCAAMACQVMWTRLFACLLGSNILTFTTVLAVLLASAGVGSWIYSLLIRTPGSHETSMGLLVMGLGLSMGGTVAGFVHVTAFGGALPATLLGRACLVAAVLLVPGLLTGAVLPAAIGCLRGMKGPAAGGGAVCAAGAAGDILGALAAGYVWIRLWGASRSVLLIGSGLVLAGIVWLWAAAPVKRVGRAAFSGAAAALFAWLWMSVPPHPEARALAARMPHATLGDVLEAPEGTVTIHEVKAVPILSANPEPAPIGEVGFAYRTIAVDGTVVAGTSADLRTTQRMQAHLPLLLHGRARRVLQIGFGSGETAQQILLHKPDTLDVVEINPGVIRMARQWFPRFADGGFRVVSADAKTFVRTSSSRFDAILNDSTYPGIAGASQLYSADHFRACRSRLLPGGVCSTWVPVDLPPETFRRVLASFRSAFPNCAFYLPANCLNKHGVLVGTTSDSFSMAGRLAASTPTREVGDALGDLGYRDPSVLESTLVLDAATIAILTRDTAADTDDHPFLEYPARGLQVSGDAFWSLTLSLLLDHLPEDGSVSAVHRLAIRRILEGEIRLLDNDPDGALLAYAAAGEIWPEHPGPARLAGAIRTFRAQAAFSSGFAALDRGDAAAARRDLEQAVRLCPQSAAAQFELGRLLFKAGDASGAVAHLEACTQTAPTLSDALALLGDACLTTGRYARAEAAYRAYLETHAQGFEIRVALADALKSQGRFAEALPLLREALREKPDNETVGIYLAETLEGLGRSAEAQSALRAVLEGRPDSIPAMVQLARLLRAAGPSAEADRLMRTALEREAPPKERDRSSRHAPR